MKKRELNLSELISFRNWPIYLISILAIIIISLLFPRSKSFDYEYTQGSTWKYDDLVAPFEYPILKDETIYQAQVDEVEQQVTPVYVLNRENTQSYIERLSKQLDDEVNATSHANKFDADKYKSILTSIYDKGVVNVRKNEQVRILSGAQSRMAFLDSLYDAQKVIDKLKSDLEKDSVKLSSSTYRTLQSLISANVEYDKNLSEKFRSEAINKIPRANGLVKEGDVIVNKGDILSANDISLLDSYKVAYQHQIIDEQSVRVIFLGYLLLTCLIIIALLIFIYFNYPSIFYSWRKMLFIMIWIVFMSYLVYVIEQTGNLSAYMIPFCIVPLLIQNFYDERLAFFVHVVIILIASFLSIHGYEFTFIEILAGIVIIQASRETRYWNTFFGLIFVLLLTYILSYLGLEMISKGNLVDIDRQVMVWLSMSALFTLMAYPFIPLMEKLFGFTSSITLVELSDFNRPLLKRLSIEAPGTFQHSIQVANLAEAATDRIGGNPLLIKVAALYHDIGKLIQPEAFIENQEAYDNPHDLMSNFESAEVIISHVTEGVKMAKKAGLPTELIDFIETHHGTTRVEYFYRQQLKDEPDRQFDETLFRYPGPKPTTKEETILMLADSIEAASKSLKSPTGSEIDKLVDSIFQFKEEAGQLSQSELSFGELQVTLDTFKQMLRSIYHVRIEYPDDPNNS